MPQVRLPKLYPKYNGCLMKWVAFSDSINSLIYTNCRGMTLQREREHIVMCIYELLHDCVYHFYDSLLIYSLSLSCSLSHLFFLEVLLLL